MGTSPRYSRAYVKKETFPAIGERMKLVRIAVAGTQTELCNNIGISRPRWNQYERGRSRIPIDTAIELAQIYGVDLHWLYMGGPLEESRFPQQLRDAIKKGVRREAEVSGSDEEGASQRKSARPHPRALKEPVQLG